MKKRRAKPVKFTPEQDEIIRARYPHEHAQMVADAIGVTAHQVSQHAFYLGVKRTSEFKKVLVAELAERGRQALSKSARRSDKKESKPKKRSSRPYHPIGTERLNAKGFYERKITDTSNAFKDWKDCHRIVWEEAYGPVPEGYVITFLDGNRKNYKLENLQCITNTEMLAQYDINRWPPELQRAIKQLNKLKKEIKEHE